VSKRISILRLNKYISAEEIRKNKTNRSGHRDYKAGFSVLSRVIGGAKILDGYKAVIQQRLTRAHILLKPEEYITICIIFAIVFGLLGMGSAYSQPPAKQLLYISAGAGIGWIIPGILIKTKMKKRIKLLNDQLCDAIVLISNSLKAGYSFFQSVDIVSREMNGPIAEEFSLLQKEINLGVSTENALENLVQRVFSDDLELVVTAVLIQRQVGGNLSEVLDNISSTIRDRIKLKGEVKTVTAQGRMSGLIISLLPPVLGVIIFLINPEHMSLLFTTQIGLGIIGFSVFSELIGIYFISKIVKIEM